MSRKKKSQAPALEGLVSSRLYETTWRGRPGRSWDYFLPEDCRPTALRVIVHMWSDGKGSNVRVVEGDGRLPSFKEHAKIDLPDGADDALAAEEARKLAAQYLKPQSSKGSPDAERIAAGMLTAAGFKLDDFYGFEAWLKPAALEGFTWYIRSEAEIQFPVVKGKEMPIPIYEEVRPELTCEVGLSSDTDDGRSYALVPNLDEAVRVVEEGLLPYPSEDEVTVIPADSLFRKPGI